MGVSNYVAAVDWPVGEQHPALLHAGGVGFHCSAEPPELVAGGSLCPVSSNHLNQPQQHAFATQISGDGVGALTIEPDPALPVLRARW